MRERRMTSFTRRPLAAVTLLAAAFVVTALALSACTSTVAPTGESTAASQTCPKSLVQKSPAPRQSATPAPTAPKLVPFTPTYVVACRYSGLPHPDKLLGSATITSPSKLKRIRAELNSFSPIPPTDVFSCPADFGQNLELYIGSAGAHIEVRAPLSGCTFPVGPDGSYWQEKVGHVITDLVASTS
jgi:hypothetical protein